MKQFLWRRYSEAEINKIVGDGESHLIIESIWNSCGKGLRLLVKWARWKEVTSATSMTITSLITMILALIYHWPTTCQIILYVSSNLSLTTILKPRLLISKMSFRDMLFNQCFHLWLSTSGGEGVQPFTLYKSEIVYLLQQFFRR